MERPGGTHFSQLPVNKFNTAAGRAIECPTLDPPVVFRNREFQDGAHGSDFTLVLVNSAIAGANNSAVGDSLQDRTSEILYLNSRV
jgi:hypothetical protein